MPIHHSPAILAFIDQIQELRRQGLKRAAIAQHLNVKLSKVDTYFKSKASRDRHADWSRGIYRERLKRPYSAFRRKLSQFLDTKCYREIEKIATEWIEKNGDHVVCYLTGQIIDLNDGPSYQLDHVIPRSKGGASSLENMRPTVAVANEMKRALSVEKFVEMCKTIADYQQSTSTLPHPPRGAQ